MLGRSCQVVLPVTPEMTSKVGNQTNSQDPQAINSRVFVGNLNTFQCTKANIERTFQRYGRIAGISMHKGYAFVQFTNPFDARSACLGEDNRMVLGQVLDVNMVAEPKAHQIGRKRQNMAKSGNDWDYYYDSYYAGTGLAATPRMGPPLKRPRLVLPPSPSPPAPAIRPSHLHTNHIPQKNLTVHTNSNSNVNISQLKSYGSPDILICGNCREMFASLSEIIEHKKTHCKLRFTCKCAEGGARIPNSTEEPTALVCVTCKESFFSAWDLMVHVQSAHMVNLYELGTSKQREASEEKDKDPESSAEPKGEENGIVGGGLLSKEVLENNNEQISATTNYNTQEIAINGDIGKSELIK